VSIVPLHKLKRDWSSVALRNYTQKSTQISGARLSELLQISEGIPGTPNRTKTPEFSIPPQTPSDVKSILYGTVLHKGRPTSQQSRIAINHLPTHVGVWGTTGSGKTNTAFQLVHQTYKHNIPFLIIDLSRKKEWRRLGSRIPEVRIFTARDFRYNFLEVPIGVSVSAHINSVSTAWIAAWPTEGILKQHVEKVFRQAYKNCGWDLYTESRGRTVLVTDLYTAMQEVTHGLLYSDKLKQDFIGALTARFQTLVEDPILSVMFNTTQGLSITDLLNNYTILEFNGMSDEQKALVTSLIMVSVTDYLEAQTTPYNQQLNHLLVLEEAHHVLKRVNISSEHAAQQHAIDSLIQLLREARGLGLGVILLDQLPRHLAEAAVELPATTIIHALLSSNERLMVGSNGNLTDEQFRHIANMGVGEIVLIQGFTGQAVNVQVSKFIVDPDPTAPPWTDERVIEHMMPFYIKYSHLQEINIPLIES
ncbi:MAG: ATP-binding protein, partial [Candidatus Thorarchaeota archaeon]